MNLKNKKSKQQNKKKNVQRNMISFNKQKKVPQTNQTATDICKFSDEEFKVAILRKQ